MKYNEQRARLTARHQQLRWFDAQLKEIDPYLELVKASENVVDRDLIPGYWHIRRLNPMGLDTYLPITGPAGEFMEPHSGVLEQLRGGDLQRPGAWERLLAKHDEEERQRQKRIADQRADFKEEFALRYKAKANPGVSFSTAKPWTYRAGARKG